MKRLERRLLGVFADPGQAARAVEALQRLGDCRVELYAPVPDHHLLDVAPRRFEPVRYFTGIGGLCGLAGGFALAFWTASLFELFLSGMEWNSLVPFVIIGFEVTVLLGGLATLLGLMIGSRLPGFFSRPLWDPRLSEDCFGVGVDCREGHVERCAKVLREHGADDVHRAK
jgi:molybdopterin-containing oxidoreductase family membrane subunit